MATGGVRCSDGGASGQEREDLIKPLGAVMQPAMPGYYSTVGIPDELIVDAARDAVAVARLLDTTFQTAGWTFTAMPVASVTSRPSRAPEDVAVASVLWITGYGASAGSAPDAWQLLQAAWRAGVDVSGVGVNHVLTTTPDLHPDLVGALDGGIDPVSGHGTFLVGIVHQLCPDADILMPRVADSLGRVRTTSPGSAEWWWSGYCPLAGGQIADSMDACVDAGTTPVTVTAVPTRTLV